MMVTIVIAKDEKKIKETLEDILSREGHGQSAVNNPQSLQEKIIELENSLYQAKRGNIYKSVLDEVERPLLEHTLERTEGNQLKAARILGINRNTMRAKIKKLSIDVNKWKV